MLFTERSLRLQEIWIWEMDSKQPLKNKAWHMPQMQERTPWEEPGKKILHSQQD